MKKIFSKLVTWSLVLSLTFEATPVWALSKDETIYAKLNSDGRTNSVTVSEHLNDNGSMEIVDRSHLNNIKNINGDETYTKDGDKLVWEAKGNDIYYEGNTSENLPIEMNVKYYLNDEEMSVNDMLGKAGKVRIVLNYKNNKVNYVPVNGKIETLYTPFVVATTSLLSNTDNKNIKVTNGRVIDNGVTSVIVAISSPGLYESLNIEELKDLDKVEISYDTEYFELNSIYSVATSKILEDNDLDILNNVKDLYSSIGLLQDNMDKLVDASSKLKDGSSMIANGTNELYNATNKITSTYFNYRNMDKNSLKKEITKIIQNNMQDIIPVLEKLVIEETEEAIKNHREDIEKSVVDYSIQNTKDVINGELEKAIKNIKVDDIVSKIIGSDLLNALLSDESLKELTTVFRDELNKELSKEINKVTMNTINGLSSTITNDMTPEEQYAYIDGLAKKYNVTFEQAAAIASEVQNDTINGIKNKLNNSSEQIGNNISNQVISSLNNKDYVNGLVNDYVTNVNKRIEDIIGNDTNISEYQKELINNISETIKKELSKDEIIKKYSEASTYFDSLINTIINNTAQDIANEYTGDIAMEVINNLLKNGIDVDSELSKILDRYEDKLSIVDSNVSKLQSSIELLNNGSNELANGMKLFDEGLNKYNTEGISKLSSFINGDVKSIEGKIEALINLSNNYKTMDDIDSDATGSSKIIFMIDSVKKEKEKKVNNEKIVEKKTFLEKIKGLFK